MPKDPKNNLRGSARKNFSLRGPSHGLQDSPATQRRAGNSSQSTRTIRHSQLLQLQKQSDAAEAARQIVEEPDVIIEEEFSAPGFGTSAYEHRLPEDFEDANGWQDLRDPEIGDEEVDEGLVEVQAKMRRAIGKGYKDFRTRRDRTNKTWLAFEPQMEEVVAAFMEWEYSEKKGVQGAREPLMTLELFVVDVFGSSAKDVPLLSGFTYNSSSLIRAGVIPTASSKHRTGISIRTVALYHRIFVRCPKLGIQPFIKSICDAESIPFQPYLARQMSVAFDLYVAILNATRLCVQKALGRDGPNWRMLNSCPPCQYRLEGEEQLQVRMLASMDGNDSLRRVERQDVENAPLPADPDAGPSLPPSKELPDHRVGGGDYFLPYASVDAWDEANWADVQEVGTGLELSPEEQLWADGQCEERWHNAQDKNTVRSVGRFFEYGWFTLLCRHMLLLVACDMVRSGEQSKYPLATLHCYTSAEVEERKITGEGRPVGKLAVAYDIHCKLSKTVKRSPLRTLAAWCRYLPVIGTMHGFAHIRACQLLFLMLYIVWTGLEDGEGNERYYSVTNALAGVTRHQSTFHRRQSIAEFAYYHDNLETYSKLSTFIHNNYKQALGILHTKGLIASAMKDTGIVDSDIFYKWLLEEGDYLRSLTKVPPLETLKMEYFTKLEALNSCIARLIKAQSTLYNYQHVGGPNLGAALERKTSNEVENERKLIADIQLLEWKLEVESRWVLGSEQWEAAKKLVREAAYRKALDKLEGLLVARIFEMTRLNVAGTGYKLRKHIANALKLRSKSIKTAIESYNIAATGMIPPRQRITWEQVLEYSYLSEFDILRDTRCDVRERPWATQKNRMLMQEFFKLIRAENELPRLHVEIKRLFTYMAKEEERLKSFAQAVKAEDPTLSLQIMLHWAERGRFNDLHRKKLLSIKKLEGFDFVNNKYFCVGVPVRKEDPIMEAEAEDDVLPLDNDAGSGSEVEEEDNSDEIEFEIDAALSIVIDIAE